jgi:hypothetical protein
MAVKVSFKGETVDEVLSTIRARIEEHGHIFPVGVKPQDIIVEEIEPTLTERYVANLADKIDETKVDDTKNLSDLEIYEMEDIRVSEFHPLPDGQGDPTQVHLTMKPKGASEGTLLVLRLKSRDSAVQLISALVEHTNSVWPVPDVDLRIGAGKSEPPRGL